MGRLAEASGVPVLALHAPCLAVTQRVWTADPVERLRRSVAAAGELGASTVVVHPPFRWQRRYAAVFDDEVRRAEEHTGIAVAVACYWLTVPLARAYQAGRRRALADRLARLRGDEGAGGGGG